MRQFDVSEHMAIAAQKQQARLVQQQALAKAATCCHQTATALPAPAACPTPVAKLSAKEAKKASKAKKKAPLQLKQGLVIVAPAPLQAPARTPAEAPAVTPALLPSQAPVAATVVEPEATAARAGAPPVPGNAAKDFVKALALALWYVAECLKYSEMCVCAFMCQKCAQCVKTGSS